MALSNLYFDYSFILYGTNTVEYKAHTLEALVTVHVLFYIITENRVREKQRSLKRKNTRLFWEKFNVFDRGSLRFFFSHCNALNHGSSYRGYYYSQCMKEIKGKSILVRVSARFELATVRVIGSRLYFYSGIRSIERTLKRIPRATRGGGGAPIRMRRGRSLSRLQVELKY